MVKARLSAYPKNFALKVTECPLNALAALWFFSPTMNRGEHS